MTSMTRTTLPQYLPIAVLIPDLIDVSLVNSEITRAMANEFESPDQGRREFSTHFRRY